MSDTQGGGEDSGSDLEPEYDPPVEYDLDLEEVSRGRNGGQDERR